MRIKNKRVLKNGAIAGYVYYKKDKKWKWRIVGHVKKNKKGGSNNCQVDWSKVVFNFFINSDGRIVKCPSKKLKSFFEMLNNKYPDYWAVIYGKEEDYHKWVFSLDCVKPVVDLKSFICESEIGRDYFKNEAIILNSNNRNSKKSIDFYVDVQYIGSNINNNNNNNPNYNNNNNNYN